MFCILVATTVWLKTLIIDNELGTVSVMICRVSKWFSKCTQKIEYNIYLQKNNYNKDLIKNLWIVHWFDVQKETVTCKRCISRLFLLNLSRRVF